jgi:hypothetical protein
MLMTMKVTTPVFLARLPQYSETAAFLLVMGDYESAAISIDRFHVSWLVLGNYHAAWSTPVSMGHAAAEVAGIIEPILAS